MNRCDQKRPNERGIALVVVMLILLVMTLLAIVMMSGVTMNREVTGHDQRMRKALNNAEAGIGEAMARIKQPGFAMPTGNVNATVQIFNTVAGSVPALGVDSTGYATAQPAGAWLSYTTATRGPDALTISFKKNAAGTTIMKYDGTKNPAINTVSGMPIYVIQSTGTVGGTKRTVVAEVIQKPFIANVKAAMAANVPISVIGNAFVCGYDHRSDTADGDGENGRMPGGATYCFDNENGLGVGDLPGAWSTGTIDFGGASNGAGSPTKEMPSQTGFYAGPWEALGMSQAEYYAWIGAPQVNPSSLNGLLYLDNNSTTQDQSGNFAFHGQSGEGLLYVDGNLHVNSGFTYRGLVYIEGDLDINGKAWILGGIIVRGQTNIKFNGGATVLYSSAAITQALAKYGGEFVTLSWREK